jgi:dTDP-L-rhamnose 4-epimerase
VAENVLVTGGAGFIGSHLVDALTADGHRVRVFDNLEPQVHGLLRESEEWPEYSHPDAEYILGDVRDRNALVKAMRGIDVVFHQAAMVGVGQSMSQVERYVDVNSRGTAVLLDIIINDNSIRDRLRKIIVASSMSIYGEGKYDCSEHGAVFPRYRTVGQLALQDWELHCPLCDRNVWPRPTDEDVPLEPMSIYAISKKDQEELSLVTGRAYQIPVIALRYFNTYGPRQALSNPYTGVAAIFSSRLLNGKAPVIFEDGLQTRDFVHVSDIVQANRLAMESAEMDYLALNVGSGRPVTILEVAEALGERLLADTQPKIIGEYRAGDIRHCYSDISKISRYEYETKVSLFEGLSELAAWYKSNQRENQSNEAGIALARRSPARWGGD